MIKAQSYLFTFQNFGWWVALIPRVAWRCFIMENGGPYAMIVSTKIPEIWSVKPWDMSKLISLLRDAGSRSSNSLVFGVIREWISWWRHQMETFPRYWPFGREFTGHLWFPRTKSSDAELWCFLWSLICAWINVWVNNYKAGDLRRHRAHDDVILIWVERTILSLGLLCVGNWMTASHRCWRKLLNSYF